MKKREWFKARKARATDDAAWFSPPPEYLGDTIRVRVVDARELTPEKAVERVLRKVFFNHPFSYLESLASAAEMTVTIKKGVVKVRRAK